MKHDFSSSIGASLTGRSEKDNTSTTAIEKVVEVKKNTLKVPENKVIEEVNNENNVLLTSEKNENQPKLKVGRPKGEESVKVSVNIINKNYRIAEACSRIKYKSFSAYINALIEADVNKNKEQYEQLMKLF